MSSYRDYLSQQDQAKVQENISNKSTLVNMLSAILDAAYKDKAMAQQQTQFDKSIAYKYPTTTKWQVGAPTTSNANTTALDAVKQMLSGIGDSTDTGIYSFTAPSSGLAPMGDTSNTSSADQSAISDLLDEIAKMGEN